MSNSAPRVDCLERAMGFGGGSASLILVVRPSSIRIDGHFDPEFDRGESVLQKARRADAVFRGIPRCDNFEILRVGRRFARGGPSAFGLTSRPRTPSQIPASPVSGPRLARVLTSTLAGSEKMSSGNSLMVTVRSPDCTPILGERPKTHKYVQATSYRSTLASRRNPCASAIS